MTKRIAHITDIHLDEEFPIEKGVNARANWQLILEDVAARNIDEIIFTGDIGEQGSNEWFFGSLEKYAPSLKITLGNHDHFSEVEKHYTNDFLHGNKELYYSYEDNYLKYIFLDSSADKISTTQFEWLMLQMDTPKKIILFMHHPVLAIETYIDKLFPLQNREKINRALQQHHQEVIIFCGHYHMMDETTDGKIKQFVTPAGSYQVNKQPEIIDVDTSFFGYRIIEITGENITTEVIINKHGHFITEN